MICTFFARANICLFRFYEVVYDYIRILFFKIFFNVSNTLLLELDASRNTCKFCTFPRSCVLRVKNMLIIQKILRVSTNQPGLFLLPSKQPAFFQFYSLLSNSSFHIYSICLSDACIDSRDFDDLHPFRTAALMNTESNELSGRKEHVVNASAANAFLVVTKRQFDDKVQLVQNDFELFIFFASFFHFANHIIFLDQIEIITIMQVNANYQ